MALDNKNDRKRARKDIVRGDGHKYSTKPFAAAEEQLWQELNRQPSPKEIRIRVLQNIRSSETPEQQAQRRAARAARREGFRYGAAMYNAYQEGEITEKEYRGMRL